MQRQPAYLLLLLLLLCSFQAAYAQSAVQHPHTGHGHGEGSAYSGLRFIENEGQWPENVLLRAEIPGGLLWVERKGLTYDFIDNEALHEVFHSSASHPVTVKQHVVKVEFLNAQSDGAIVLNGATPEYYNFLRGSDPSKWATGVKAWTKAVLKDVWPGIDLEMLGEAGGIKYNFIVHPKAEASSIALAYKGANDVTLVNGKLNIHTSVAHMVEEEPVAWTLGKKGKQNVEASYALSGNVLRYDLSSYKRRDTLVIDPLVVFATYSGSLADNFGFTGTYDQQGFAYSGGTAYERGFPTTPGAFQQDWHGGDDDEVEGYPARDCGILKYSADGTKLEWATYLGGAANEQPHSMVVNSEGELLIMGTTTSWDFPMGGNSFQRQLRGVSDIFVAKLSNDGRALLASTYIGGTGRDGLNGDDPTLTIKGPLAYNYGDYYRGEIIVDNDDNIIVATSTQSINFPIINGFRNSLGGPQDGCVFQMNSGLSQLRWSTYLGGESHDASYGVAMNKDGDFFICGGTMSNGFPNPGGGAMSTRPGNSDADGYIVKLSPSGQHMATTFIGTNVYDQSYFVQISPDNEVYATGQTASSSFPITSGVYSNTNGKQFIISFSADLKTRMRATVFGSGSPRVNISPSAFLVDLCGRVYVSGWGGRTNYEFYNPQTGNTDGMPITQDAYQKTTDGSDFYLIILSKQMTSIVYASYFGGNRSAEHVDGGTSRFDRDGKVYQSVCGGCNGHSDFPTTPGAWSRTNNSRFPYRNCNNAFFKLDLNSSTFAPEIPETTLVVYAGEEVNHQFNVIDRDPQDSVFVYFDGEIFNPGKVPAPSPTYQTDSGMRSVPVFFNWKTDCQHISTDTYYVTVRARDNGCPTPRVSEEKLKIVVLPPPIPEPPAIFCLRRVDDHTLSLNWDEFEVQEYFREYRLVKHYPSGVEEVIKTITSTDDVEYIDSQAPGHATQDYCYFIYGVNRCGTFGDSTRSECSIPDEDSIPTSTYVHTVTVEQNKNIKVVWNQYERGDFYRYFVYRKENTSDAKFVLYATLKNLTDTTFLDTNVNVHAKSYCYKIIVNNQCGLNSRDGNYGCSILLKGESVPFEHNLSWNPYRQWPANVKEYYIIRRDAYNTYDTLVGISPGGVEQFKDDKLNYDVGLYWYRVVAFEQGGQMAQSVSNEIELVQAPHVYVPNAFTPNGDSTNDFFNVVPVFVKDYKIKVFNRWGGLVWEADNKKVLWDGTWDGRKPFDNVFIWQVDYSGWDRSKHWQDGNVTVIW